MADGIFSFLRQDPNQMPQRTFMSRLGSAAAVLNPMNPMASQYGQMMDARLQDRRQEYTRNKSIEELQRRAQGGDKLAERYLSSVQSGALQPSQAFSAYYQQMASEDQFRRQQAAVAGREQAKLQQQADQVRQTVAYLKSIKRDDLAAMVEANPALASATMSEILKQSTQPQTSGYTREQISLMGSLRDDLRKDTETYKLIGEGYDRIKSFYNNPNAVTDYALAVAFAKILDPGSVAREGEVAAVANAGAKVPALGQALKNAITGEGQLTPTVRQQIAEAARGEYMNVVPKAQSTIAGYERIAGQAGLTLQDIYAGPSFQTPEPIIPSIIPQSAIDAGLEQEDWTNMPIEDKRAFLNG